MKKEDEEYYSGQMHVLADKFNEMAQAMEKKDALKPPAPADGEKLTQMRDDFLLFAAKLQTDFSKSGYSYDDWNDLMDRSGAGKRLGMGG